VQIFRRVVVVLAAMALCAPAVAAAQASTIPESGSGVSTRPPVTLGGDATSGSGKTEAKPSSGGLPNTGSDPRLLFLVGVAMTLLGVGLRLRTADADLY
jgi:LPXTG-motif cell wall-anchored protein